MTINLGNFVTIGGKTVGNGIASGLDTQAIIESILEAQSVPITRLEDDIEVNNSQVTAYGDMRSIVENLRSATNFLRNPPGLSGVSSNVFEFRTSTASHSNSSLLAENFLSATTASGADLGSYEVAIGTLAEALEQRTNAFTSRSTSVTEAAGGSTAGYFSEGTFRLVTSQNVTSSTTGVGYTYFGAGDGVTVSSGAPLSDITVGEDPSILQGGFSSVIATVDGSNVDITITLDNGAVYTADDVPADQGGGSDSVLADDIVFTNALDGSTFSLNMIAETVIDGNQGNADTFAAAIATGLAGVDLAQERRIANFNTNLFTNTTLEGMDATNILYTADDFAANADIGDISEFTVTAATSEGAGDATITVVIDGETFTATGLGNGSDEIITNVTLTSGSSDKTLQLNFGDADVTVSVDEDGAATLQTLLNQSSPAKVGEITISQGDSLVDIAAAINLQSSQSGVTASILQVADDDFRLTLQASEEGVDNAYTFVDPDGVFSEITLNTIQTAVDAEFSINGITTTRSTNTITDVIEGVTLNLLQVTSDFEGPSEESITIGVKRDTETVNQAIVNFLDAYNAYRVFVAEQTQRGDDGSYLETAILQNETPLGTLSNRYSSQVIRAVSNTDNPLFARLSDIGIVLADFAGDDETPATSNILQVDSTELSDALQNNFEDVRDIFEFGFRSTSSTVSVYSRTNETTLENFKLDIDTSRTGDEVRVLDTNDVFLFNAEISASASGAYTISGADDTSLEGLQLLYTGDGTDVVTLGLSFGIADQVYNISNEALDEDEGLIQNAVDALVEAEERLEDDIDKLQASIDRQRALLEAQFVALEAAISQVNVLLNFLEVQSQSIFDD